MMMCLRIGCGALLVLSSFFMAPATVTAQYGVSSASMSMARAGLPPVPDAVLVEEFVNFHRHKISLPKEGQAVGLDVRLGSPHADNDCNDVVLQVGLSTRPIPDPKKVPPLNIALVIDRSGSMSGDRIANVKKSLLAFVGRLRATDRVTIVAFNDTAETVLGGKKATDIEVIQTVIESLQAGGSTNVHAGLILGYQQVLKNFDKTKTNRVILLTDGITNTGVTDAEQIIRESREFNDKGVDLSTIGLGHDLNHRLLRQLAKAGRGLIHFVDDSKDIKKIFIDELESLLSPLARHVEVKIRYDGDLDFVRLFGYEPRFGDGEITLRLDDLNAASTQVILTKFKVHAHAMAPKPIQLSVRLNYLDLATGKPVTQEKKVELKYEMKAAAKIDPLLDPEVRKNYTIAQLAQSVKDMARLLEDEKIGDAKAVLGESIKTALARYPGLKDEDVHRVHSIANNYAATLAKVEVAKTPVD